MTKILHLTLKKKWFDLIKSGEKKFEYREIKPYWIKRLTEDFGLIGIDYHAIKFDEIHFKNGYRKDSPFMRVKWNGLEFGDMLDGHKCFAIKLGKVLEVRE